MVCGVCLGILLICLVQAEHVCCLWAERAQNSQSQNSNTYVGFSKQDGRYGSSYPQNEFRQASVQSISVGTAANGAHQPRPSTKTYLQPYQSSVKIAQSSSLSKPNWRVTKFISPRRNPFPGLSNDILSGSSLTKRNGVAHLKQGTPCTTKCVSSSSAFVQSPAREGFHSNQHVPSKPPAAALTPPNYGRTGSSKLFSPVGPPVPNRPYARMQTSARAPARRVSSRHAVEPSTQTAPRNPHKSTLFSSYTPTNVKRVSWSRNSAQEARHSPHSQRSASVQKFAPTQIHRIPQNFGGFAIRRLKEPVVQKEAPVQKHWSPTPPPQQVVAYSTRGQSVHPEAKWRRFKLNQGR